MSEELIDRIESALCDPDAPWYGSDLVPLVGDLCDEAEKLRGALAEITERHVRVMEERCPTDERHCTCVPMLRGEIDLLRARLDKLGTDNAIAQELFITERRLEKCRRLLREAAGWCERTEVWEVQAWARAARAAGGGGDE